MVTLFLVVVLFAHGLVIALSIPATTVSKSVSPQNDTPGFASPTPPYVIILIIAPIIVGGTYNTFVFDSFCV